MNEFGKGCQRPGGKGIRREGGILSRPPIITICVWLPCPTSSVCVCVVWWVKGFRSQPRHYSLISFIPLRTKRAVWEFQQQWKAARRLNVWYICTIHPYSSQTMSTVQVISAKWNFSLQIFLHFHKNMRFNWGRKEMSYKVDFCMQQETISSI